MNEVILQILRIKIKKVEMAYEHYYTGVDISVRSSLDEFSKDEDRLINLHKINFFYDQKFEKIRHPYIGEEINLESLYRLVMQFERETKINSLLK